MKKYIFLCSIAVFCNNIIANPSDIDTSFNNGIDASLFVAFSVNSAQDIAVQNDGKIVTVGYSGDNALIVRFENDGQLDTTFTNGQANQIPGTVTINLGLNTAAYALAIQPLDSKIIIAGYVNTSAGNQLFIARFNTDGTLDEDFGADDTGYVIHALGGYQTEAFDVALDYSANIVVTGTTTTPSATSGVNSSCAFVARYLPSGAIDTTFNAADTPGYKKTLFGATFTKAQALAIEKDQNGELVIDGKIVVTGQAYIDGKPGLIVFQYDNDGVLDTGFNDGTEYAVLPSTAYVSSIGFDVAVQVDGKIVVVGSSNLTDGFPNQLYTILRLNSNGTVDTTFNSPLGYSASDHGLTANSLAIQDNAQIITCGLNYDAAYIVIITRYNNDGTIDATFNFVPQTDASLNTIGKAITLQADGKVIVSGVKVIPEIL